MCLQPLSVKCVERYVSLWSHARSGIMAAQEPSPPSSLEGNKPGFPKKILANKLEDKHLCNICLKILRRPFQAQCGHRFCSYCFTKAVR